MEGDIGLALLADNKELAKKLAHYWLTLFPQAFILSYSAVGKKMKKHTLNRAVDASH